MGVSGLVMDIGRYPLLEMETERSRKGREVSEMDQVKAMEGWNLEAKLMNFPRSGREHEAAPK